MKPVIRYLEDGEKGKSRSLWEEAFPEDSREFDDYYFKEKTRDNRILVKEEDGRILSMIHLNPYLVKIKDQICPLDYIVGVATRKDRRHEGHMKSLLEQMMKDMYGRRTPFTFLMPAIEEIYRPFDFRFIFAQPAWEAWAEGAERILVPAGWTETDPERTEKLSQWTDRWLADRYQVFAIRSPGYIRRMDRELASENGQWTFLYKENRLCGIICEWGRKTREQRLCYAENSRQTGERPVIMGRIICLEEFVKNICLKKDCPFDSLEAAIQIEDQFLAENSGLWLWKLDKNSSRLERSQEKHPGNELEIFSIGEMIEWLSGYKSLERAGWTKWVQPLQGIFLDEVV